MHACIWMKPFLYLYYFSGVFVILECLFLLCVQGRIDFMVSNAFMQDSNVVVDQGLFQSFPSEMTFQSYEPHKTYEFLLFLRNLDVVVHHIKVMTGESDYSSVVGKALLQSKIALVMEVLYAINFTYNSNEVTFLVIKKCYIS